LKTIQNKQKGDAMRHKHTAQGSIFWFRPEHEICHNLDRIGHWLNQHPHLLNWIANDLGSHSMGRNGMSCSQVLRAALIKQFRQCSYRDLAFILSDSLSFQQFVRVDPYNVPGKSTLQSTISRIRPATWEKMNQLFVRDMLDCGFEPGDRLRIDSTVAESHILSPTDSKLLYDCVRVMTRLLKRLKDLTQVKYSNHSRRAKSNYFAAHCAKDDSSRYRCYKALLKDVDTTRVSLCEALEVLKILGDQPIWVEQIEALLPMVAQVMDQTSRRVMEGESVPAGEKIVSIFEPHTDIIKKGGRQVQYGHKINLTSGRTGLIYDVVIEQGNPADQSRLLPMLKRHKKIYGHLPGDIAADGGYANKENLVAAKSMDDVDNVAFHKRAGLMVKEMTGDDWLFRELRNFRAGIEAGISYLKRCFGLKRIVWKGWDRFCASIHLSIFTHNLIRWARAT
jgi:transposase, IS5 family